jgi:hypothetical protein
MTQEQVIAMSKQFEGKASMKPNKKVKIHLQRQRTPQGKEALNTIYKIVLATGAIIPFAISVL